MRLDRFAALRVPEVAGRGRQEVRKWLDRILPLGSRVTAPGAHRSRARASRPLPYLQTLEHPELAARLLERLPAARAQLLAAAERLLERRFDLLGYVELDFGHPIDWRLDPIRGRRATLEHWSRIDPLDPGGCDPKVIWELNRHQWMTTLGQAYRLTGDERFALAFSESVRAWILENPVGCGINWASSLEVALRLVSWCWTLHLCQGSLSVERRLRTTLRRWLRLHAHHIERYLSTWSSPNTHLTGEALGLFYAGCELHEAPEADRWRALGARILEEQIERQVLPDGVYFEQSTCYQRYTIETYLHYLILSERIRRPVPAGVGERVMRLLEFLAALRTRDGSVPRIGDGDGGAILPLHRRPTCDLRGLFSVAAAWFGRGDWLETADGLQPEVLWLLGPEGEAALASLEATTPSTPASRLFEHGGYAVMRGGHGPREHALVFDVGPLGPAPTAGHAHADLLAVHCAVFGEEAIVDPGTFLYAVDPVWREHFRGTPAHATISIDGLSQARPSSPFAWESVPRARLHLWVTNDSIDYADASHDAWRRLPEPVLHRRRVLFVKTRFFVVLDDLHGGGTHRVEAHFPLAPDGPEAHRGWVRLRTASRHALDLRTFSGVALERRVVSGAEEPPAGWIAPEYGRRVAAPVLRISARARLPLRLLTLLVPQEDPAVEPPPVTVLTGPGGVPQGIVLGGRDTVLFEEGAVVLNGERFP
jgi:hypothetical protein